MTKPTLPIAAIALLVNEVSKLTLGQHLDVLTLIRHTQCWSKRSLLVDWRKVNKISGPLNRNPSTLVLWVCQILNPATLLPVAESGDSLHHCINTIEQTYSSRSDLLDESLDSPEVKWFTDGSSFIEMGTWKVGHAIASLDQVTEAKAPPTQTSAQMWN